jgi:hypothetical protein
MKGLALGLLLGVGVVAGCSNNESGPTTKPVTGEVKTGDAQSSDAGVGAAAAAPVQYQEVPSGNAIYVVASKASADKVRAGQKITTVTAIGFGPQGEKVYFETDKDGKLDRVLMAEYQRRHGR